MRERESHKEAGVRERVSQGSWCERESLTTKLVRSRLKWAGYVERMEGNG